MADNLWSLVLAAGSGRRLSPVTQGVPKQFWRAHGRRSLLEETLARIGPLAPPARTTVVVDRTHRRYVEGLARTWPVSCIVYQPEDRGTAAGVLLALSPILKSAPDAIVLLTPSDHAVADPGRFRSSVEAAAAVVQSGRLDAVLFGVEPSAPLTDYGWIAPGLPYRWVGSLPLRRVVRFVEKFGTDLSHELFVRGALWNTMVLLVRAQTLLDLYRRHLPGLARTFEIYRHLPPATRETFLADQYRRLPPVDFSRDVLAAATGLAVYAWGPSLGWSDLGTPDRLQRWLHDLAQMSLDAGAQTRHLGNRLAG